MVKDYLEHYRDFLLKEKISCENEEKKLEQRLKENKEFRGLLEEKNDPNFEAFTPHIVHSKDKEKIHELEMEEKEITKKQEDLKEKIDGLEKRLTELTSVINVAFEQEKELKLIADVIDKETLSKVDKIVSKLALCSNLAEVDARRCKLEINSLSETVAEVKEKLYEIKQIASISQIENDGKYPEFEEVGSNVSENYDCG